MTSEVASFSEHAGAWIIWAVNLACVFATVIFGVALALKKKALFLLPLVVCIAATHGTRWFVASLHHDYPIPKVMTIPDAVDAHGHLIPLISHSADIDLIAWGSALSVLLAYAANKKGANQPPQTTTGSSAPDRV